MSVGVMPKRSSQKVRKDQVDAGVLAVLLSDAMIFAGHSRDLPSLHAVRLESTVTELLAVGCDRFSLGVARAPLESIRWEVNLDLSDVRTILTLCREHKGEKVRLARTATGLRFSFGTRRGTDLTVSDNGLLYPQWRPLIPATVEAAESNTPVMGFSPARLAKFARVKSSTGDMRLLWQPHKPLGVRIGDNFVGILMPYRLPEGTDREWRAPKWLS